MKERSKYNSRKIVTEDGTFDSVRELDRWEELKLMCVGGKIRRLQRQVEFELIPAQYAESWTGKRGAEHQGKLLERKCCYVADFAYEERHGDDWTWVIEDCKGMRTPDYIIKRKLMLFLKGIRIRET